MREGAKVFAWLLKGFLVIGALGGWIVAIVMLIFWTFILLED